MPIKHFLDGLEETIARIVSLLLSLTFFALYFGGKAPVFTDWYGLIGVLALFWLVYESVSYLLYIVFNFFSAKSGKDDNSNSKVDTNNFDMNHTENDGNNLDQNN